MVSQGILNILLYYYSELLKTGVGGCWRILGTGLLVFSEGDYLASRTFVLHSADRRRQDLKKLYIEKIASDYIQHVLPDILRQHQKAPHFKWQQHVMEISEKSPF